MLTTQGGAWWQNLDKIGEGAVNGLGAAFTYLWPGNLVGVPLATPVGDGTPRRFNTPLNEQPWLKGLFDIRANMEKRAAINYAVPVVVLVAGVTAAFFLIRGK